MHFWLKIGNFSGKIFFFSFVNRIGQLLESLHLDKRDSVRERFTDVILEMSNHNYFLVSEKMWSFIALMALDRKEKVRAGAIRTIVDTYCKYSEDQRFIPKIHDLRSTLFQIYLKAESLSSSLPDVQKGDYFALKCSFF